MHSIGKFTHTENSFETILKILEKGNNFPELQISKQAAVNETLAHLLKQIVKWFISDCKL